jgi:cytochrome c-type biogenesis protein CcmE
MVVEMRIRYTHIIVVVLLVLSGALAFDAFNSYIDPYLTATQLIGDSSAYINRNVQVLGTIVNESTAWMGDGTLLFNLTDGESTLRIRYNGSPPQNFNEGLQVVVIGRLTSSGVMDSSKMLVKCPSKYEGNQSSLFTDPIFIIAIILGIVSIAIFVARTTLKRNSAVRSKAYLGNWRGKP